MRKPILAALFVAIALPFAASALTVDEIQAQIQQLLFRLGQQSTSIGAGATTPAPGSSMPYVLRICRGDFTTSISFGSRGTAVLNLQEFLIQEKYLNASATGYFGPATRAALLKYQADAGIASSASAGAGIVGPRTREYIQRKCRDSGQTLTATPTSGPTPLPVTFTAQLNIANPRLVADAGSYKIDFGDGNQEIIPCNGSESFCNGTFTIKYTYTKNGTYTARIVHFGFFGPGPESVNGVTVAQKTIVVGGGYNCEVEYRPVCASKPIVCVTTPCTPMLETYANRCMALADGSTVIHEGQCSVESDPASDPTCKSWYDGCNSCSRSAAGSPAMCTLRACTPGSMTKPYCSERFPTNSTNRPPVISAFSGPTTLTINEVGTWSITASDPENQRLSYSILWGDEWAGSNTSARLSAPDASIIQRTSLTHSYARAGTYPVQVTITDTSGASAQMTATVFVSQSACTKEYAPVCGRPPGCTNSCPAGMYCAAICRLHEPTTYGNRCTLNNANAEFLYEGACPAN